MKQKSFLRSRGLWIVLLALVLLLVSLTAGVFASLGDSTAVVTVRGASVSCAVDQDYSVQNTGSVPVLLRAKVVINWLDEDGNILALPPAGASVSIEAPVGWQKLPADAGFDAGYWYYTGILEAGGKAPFLGSVTADGGEVRVTVLAEALQYTPPQAAEEAWGAVFANGVWRLK